MISDKWCLSGEPTGRYQMIIVNLENIYVNIRSVNKENPQADLRR